MPDQDKWTCDAGKYVCDHDCGNECKSPVNLLTPEEIKKCYYGDNDTGDIPAWVIRVLNNAAQEQLAKIKRLGWLSSDEVKKVRQQTLKEVGAQLEYVFGECTHDGCIFWKHRPNEHLLWEIITLLKSGNLPDKDGK